MYEIFLESALDAFLDCLKMLPFLYVAFFIMEWLEQHSEGYLSKLLQNNRFGPAIGAIFGCVPQCGFSALTASLFCGGAVSAGTLLAVFLSTSDEAVLIMMSDPSAIGFIGNLLLVKIIIAIIGGYLLNAILGFLPFKKKEVEDLCDDCGCHEHHSVIRSAWNHTFKLFRFILVFTFVLNMIIAIVGIDGLETLFLQGSLWQPLLTSLIGLIPNCAASVLIAQLYLEGVIGFGAVVAGLCSGAGVGLIILFKVNKNKVENFTIVGILYLIAVVSGMLIQFCGL